MVSPRKNLDIGKFLLTDEFSEEGLIKIKSEKKINDKSSKSKNKKKLNKKEIENISKNINFTGLDDNDYPLKDKSKDKSKESNVEFIIVEDDENEKKLIINLQIKMKESLEGTELIKIDFEIGKEIYLDLIKELLK